MPPRRYKYLFGPVPSRRLGRSLGVDLVPFKTFSFECIFCQLGRTTHKTAERREYAPADAILGELADWLKSGGEADVITLAGSGEPTLNSEFGRIIEFVRRKSSIPVALLTNGSLLSDPEVRRQAAQADIVKVSLSAWNTASLQRINRPHPGLDFARLVEGQRQFRREFQGRLWMEVFLVWGLNTAARDVSAVARWAKQIHPDKIQLNTAVRPPCEAFARLVPPNRMKALARLFAPPADVIAEYSSDRSAGVQATEIEVLAMIERRPCTLDQICRVFGLHRNEAAKYTGKLVRTGQAREQRREGRIYYLGSHD